MIPCAQLIFVDSHWFCKYSGISSQIKCFFAADVVVGSRRVGFIIVPWWDEIPEDGKYYLISAGLERAVPMKKIENLNDCATY